jgi:hypothetical protein
MMNAPGLAARMREMTWRAFRMLLAVTAQVLTISTSAGSPVPALVKPHLTRVEARAFVSQKLTLQPRV